MVEAVRICRALLTSVIGRVLLAERGVRNCSFLGPPKMLISRRLTISRACW